MKLTGMPRRLVALGGVLGMTLASTGPINAGAVSALTISGTVSLPTGVGISGANVTDGAGHVAVTAANGSYAICAHERRSRPSG